MTITIVAPACAFTDYGYTAIELFDRLRDYGHETKFKPLSVLERFGKREVKVPQVVKDSFVKQADGVEIWVCDAAALPQPSQNSILVSTLRGVSKKHVEILNRFQSIACVGGSFRCNIADQLGFGDKVHSVDPGVEFSIFDNEYRKTLKRFTATHPTMRLLACGRNERSLLLESWRESFKGVKDVRLCVMCDDGDLFRVDDDRVNIVEYPTNNRQLANIMASHDAFVVPSTRCDFRIFEQCFAASLPTIGITHKSQGLTAWSKLDETDLICDKMELIGQMRLAYLDRKTLADSIKLRVVDGWGSIKFTVDRIHQLLPT